MQKHFPAYQEKSDRVRLEVEMAISKLPWELPDTLCCLGCEEEVDREKGTRKGRGGHLYCKKCGRRLTRTEIVTTKSGVRRKMQVPISPRRACHKKEKI